MELEQMPEEYKCTKCKKQFKIYAKYKKHLETHNLSCDKCSVSFKTYHQKRRHNKSNHPQVKEKKCRVCPELVSFKTEEEYLLHVRDIHEGKFIDCYMCNVCGKTFKTRSELTQHINSKCGTEKQFICKVCGQKLMSPGSLYNHMRRHNDKASFMCRFCAKLFLTAGQLKVHERIHTQQRDFLCNVCGKGFCHRQSLITHSSVHTGIKPYQCEGCGKSFSCVGNLLKHRKTHSDTCGLLPLTTHRVDNPSTKIKVRINTPASSKLKELKKKKEIQEKFAKLDSAADSDKPKDAQEDTVSNKSEETNVRGRCSIKINVKTINNVVEYSNVTLKDCATNVPSSEAELAHDPEDDLTQESEREENDNSAEEDDDLKDDDVTDVEPQSRKTYRRNKDPVFDMEVTKFIKERDLENVKKAACKFCNKEYTQFRWLYKHEQDHEKNDVVEKGEVKNLPFKCSCCKKCFETKEDVKQHQQLAHSDVLCSEAPFWKKFYMETLEEGQRREIFGKYPITDGSLLPRKLNPQIECSLPADIRKKDTRFLEYQTQMVYGLSALDKIFRKCANNPENHSDVKEELVDSAKIFADLHHMLFLHRRNNIIPYLDQNKSGSINNIYI